MTSGERPAMGLRERKKIKTRAAIQQHAVRLIREQGYQATTIEQIAEAADISPSTFFRYFSTKEAVVLEDDYDPLLSQYFREQPKELSPIQAMRNAVKLGTSAIPEEDLKAFRERMELTFSVPELRAASMNQMLDTMRLISELVGERVGVAADDLQVMTFSGAVIGTIWATQIYALDRPNTDSLSLMEESLAYLEKGLPIAKGDV
ncbi:TetR family transcriptional regulator [Cohnella soli]|uniref:TetR family transcriptional regulator n=1 Tax=Cohnella soli TaxID=425005 RepID=A0ABW0HXK3_9BACL